MEPLLLDCKSDHIADRMLRLWSMVAPLDDAERGDVVRRLDRFTSELKELIGGPPLRWGGHGRRFSRRISAAGTTSPTHRDKDDYQLSNTGEGGDLTPRTATIEKGLCSGDDPE